jgi:sRNA-binding protein
LNIAGESAGHEEAVERVQHAHEGRRDGDHHEERQHQPREQDRQLELARHLGEAAGEHPDQRRREHHPEDHEQPRGEQERVTTWRPSRHAASLPSRVSVRVNVGTNAALIAPSAKRSRTRLGMRNATL